MRIPTEKQYERLLTLGDGAAGLSWTTGAIRPFISHDWVTAEQHGRYWHMVRITPRGLQALAAAVERYGLPGLGPKAKTTRRVCADCGGSSYRFEAIPVEQHIAEAA